MTGDRHNRTALLASAALLPALVLVPMPGDPAAAQTPGSVQDFSLPPGPARPTPTPKAAGPVDPENPVAGPPRPAVPPAPPSPTPVPASSSTGAPEPLPSPGAEPRAPRLPRAPAASPSPLPAPVSAAPSSERSPVPSAPAATEPAAPAPARGTKAPNGTSPWPWITAGTAVLLTLAGLVFWRRRRRNEPDEIGYAPAPAPAAASPPATLPKPRHQPAAPPPPPAPAPAPAAAPPRPLEVTLEARHLSRAMINATLAYRLTLTNHTAVALGPLRLAGDIVSAHASLSAADQFGPADEALVVMQQVPGLAPGESTTLVGELRLPIASILPIRSGAARVFVPLARFRIAGDDMAMTRVFVVGQASEQPGGALRPFPLDRGPGVDRGLGQRELEVPA